MPNAFGYATNGGPDVQEFFDLDMPQPLAGELLIEVRAAGVNPVDWKIRSGAFGKTTAPVALGVEVSGVVRAVGQDADGFAVGDEVFGSTAPGSGGYAEYTLTTAAATAAKPPHVSFLAAATLPVAAATAYDGVTQLNLRPGQTLLINGVSGGVGVAAAQIARDLDINVIGIAGPDKQPLVEALGATFISYGGAPDGSGPDGGGSDGGGPVDQIRQIMPDGVDAIFDLAGGPGLRAIAELLVDRTKLITAGDTATATELGGRRLDRDGTARVLKIVAGLVADGKLDPHVQDVRPLTEAAEALAAVEVGHAKGKVVLQVS